MIRPRTPRDLAEQQALARIASLAAQILGIFRQSGRGMYDSERQLRSWLSDWMLAEEKSRTRSSYRSTSAGSLAPAPVPGGL
jgi:hypothetical protein